MGRPSHAHRSGTGSQLIRKQEVGGDTIFDDGGTFLAHGDPEGSDVRIRPGLWICAATLGLLLAVGSGCDVARLTAPQEGAARWGVLAFYPADSDQALRIDSGGALDLRVGADSLISCGRLAPATQRALAQSASGVEMAAASDPPAGAGGSTGWVVMEVAGAWRGFSWDAQTALTPAQLALRVQLERLHAQAAGEGSERVDGIPTYRLLRGDCGAMGGRAGVVVRDADSLLELLRGPLGGQSMLLPEIDFEHEMVIAVFAGSHLPSNSRVVIDAVASATAGGYLQVPVTLYQPSPECAQGIGATPFDLVRLRRVDREVFFVWFESSIGCLGN